MRIFFNFLAIIVGIFCVIFLLDYISFPIVQSNKFFIYLFFKNFYETSYENEIIINEKIILIDKKCTFLIPLSLTFPIIILNSKIKKTLLFIFLIPFLSISRQIFEVFFIIEFNFYTSLFSDIQNIYLPIFIYSIFLRKSIRQLKLFRTEQQQNFQFLLKLDIPLKFRV